MADKRIVLLVEDNPDDEALTLRALKKNNILNEVIVARDGSEALDYLLGSNGSSRVPIERIAVVLLDLKLPKVNGIEVLRRLRADARTKLLPIVILTSSKEEKDLLSAYDSGANSYVQKPVEFADFVKAAGALGLYWLVTNAPPPAR